MKRPRRHSLSGRLLGLFLLTGVLLAGVIHLGFRLGLSEPLREIARPHVAEYVQYLLTEIGDPPDPQRARALAERLPLEIHIKGPSSSWSSGDSPPPEVGHLHSHPLPDGSRIQAGRRGGDFVLISDRGEFRVILLPRELETSDRLPLAGLLTVVGVLGVLALAYHAIRRLFRPLEAIRSGLGRIGRGRLEQPVEVRRRDELGELAQNVNTMAGQIRHMLEAKRQLLLAISHELRSPLTRARVNLALLPGSAERNALEEDLKEMDTLVGELLESERLNGRHAPLNLTAEDPAGLVREVIAEHFPQADISARLESVYVALDAPRIRLLVRNLLQNALRHTPSGAPPPEVSVRRGAGSWRLTVRDHGRGIPAEHLSRVTEPFYRVDSSRRRETGGYGLGLYLCRVIAEAHGGRLEIGSEEDGGTEIRAVFELSEGGDA